MSAFTIHDAREGWMFVLKQEGVTTTAEAMRVLHDIYWRALERYAENKMESCLHVAKKYEDVLHFEETMRELRKPLRIV